MCACGRSLSIQIHGNEVRDYCIFIYVSISNIKSIKKELLSLINRYYYKNPISGKITP